jgi:hypothetical protein
MAPACLRVLTYASRVPGWVICTGSVCSCSGHTRVGVHGVAAVGWGWGGGGGAARLVGQCAMFVACN